MAVAKKLRRHVAEATAAIAMSEIESDRTPANPICE
jgi:hypothetical protein